MTFCISDRILDLVLVIMFLLLNNLPHFIHSPRRCTCLEPPTTACIVSEFKKLLCCNRKWNKLAGNRRNTTLSNKRVGDPVYEQSFISWVRNIGDQMAHFKNKCEHFKRKMLRKYCVEQSHHHLNVVQVAVERRLFMREFYDNDPSFLEKMRMHFDQLNELASYVEQLLPSNETYTRNLQSNIYASMCSLKMALRSQNQDPITRVPDEEVSDQFMESAQRELATCEQQRQEYRIVLESLRIATILKSMYSSF